MQAREVSRDRWPEFLERFSRNHEGWLVNIEIVGDEQVQNEVLGGKTMGDDAVDAAVPLMEVRLRGDPEGNAEEDDIEVVIGDDGQVFHTHVIESPLVLTLLGSERSEQEALRIDAADGNSWLITLRDLMPGDRLL